MSILRFFTECVMNTIEEDPVPYISPSVVQFSSQNDEIEFKSKSMWNPDWTIQNEVSITIDKSVNNSRKCFKCRRVPILIGLIIFILLTLSIIIPIIILSTQSSTKKTSTTSTGLLNNSSHGRIFEVNENWCENLLNIENKNFIGFDLDWRKSTSWSNCCLLCLNIPACQAFTYELFSSKCYFKSMINQNEIIDQRYQSGRLTSKLLV